MALPPGNADALHRRQFAPARVDDVGQAPERLVLGAGNGFEILVVHLVRQVQHVEHGLQHLAVRLLRHQVNRNHQSTSLGFTVDVPWETPDSGQDEIAILAFEAPPGAQSRQGLCYDYRILIEREELLDLRL